MASTVSCTRNRQVVFWQSARTRNQARPNVSLPTARASGVESLEIIVDSHERYAWKFSHQQASTVRRALHAGDYAIEHDGRILAGVERKSLADLAGLLTSTRCQQPSISRFREGPTLLRERRRQ